jgi:hypothetical protein
MAMASGDGDGSATDPKTSETAPTTTLDILGGFEGISNAFDQGDDRSAGASPPNPNAAVGPTHLVQVVSEKWAVYNKIDGTLLYGPAYINALFAGLEGPCATLSNSGT